MAAFLIGQATVLDERLWAQYIQEVTKTFEKYQGKVLFRGKKEKVLGGECDLELSVVIEFESMEVLNIWFESDEYQALIPLRLKAAKLNLISYHG